MRSTDSVITVALTIFLYLFFVNFESYRLIGIIVFSVIFGYFISRDEWRAGRAITLSALPAILAIVLIFVVSLFWSTVVTHSVNSISLVPVAYAFFVLMLAAVLIGVPLAGLGVFIRHYRVVRSDA